MTPSLSESTTVTIEGSSPPSSSVEFGSAFFKSSSTKVLFEGYLAAYQQDGTEEVTSSAGGVSTSVHSAIKPKDAFVLAPIASSSRNIGTVVLSDEGELERDELSEGKETIFLEFPGLKGVQVQCILSPLI